MSPSPIVRPPRPKRALRVLTALAMPVTALALVGLSAPAANAANPAGSCVLNASNFDCTLNYGFTGGQQTFDVPNAVSSVSVVGVGGTGGAGTAARLRVAAPWSRATST